MKKLDFICVMRFERLDGERSITLGDYSGGGFAAVNRVGMGS